MTLEVLHRISSQLFLFCSCFPSQQLLATTFISCLSAANWFLYIFFDFQWCLYDCWRWQWSSQPVNVFFSKLKLLKSFLARTLSLQRLTDLTILSIEVSALSGWSMRPVLSTLLHNRRPGTCCLSVTWSHMTPVFWSWICTSNGWICLHGVLD